MYYGFTLFARCVSLVFCGGGSSGVGGGGSFGSIGSFASPCCWRF